jgi:exodeoxyribonuclease VII large subunit
MRNVYTPSELNREVRLHLEAGFPRLWVEGEISNLARPASGHLYFTLKDEKAQIRCALFRGNAQGLAFRPENGQLVQLRGRLGLYEPRGEYQLVADAMEMAGEGRLRAAFEALKQALEKEGLFRPERRKPLPRAPRDIAVITSPSGAVIRDIIHVLERRWPLARVRLYPVPVQGDTAAPAICRALAAVNRHGTAEAIILGRGGGSLEDLWAFNEESVARAIAASNIPVISAVGHETDVSISDFVADLRAPTPSAAAEQLTPDIAVLRKAFDSARDQLARRALAGIQNRMQRLDELTERLRGQHPERRLAQQRDRLRGLERRLRAAAERLVGEQRLRLLPWQQRLDAIPAQLLPRRRERLAALARTLHAVSPLPTLERGYSVTVDAGNGATVRSITQLSPGAQVVTHLADGQFTAEVKTLAPRTTDWGPGKP